MAQREGSAFGGMIYGLLFAVPVWSLVALAIYYWH